MKVAVFSTKPYDRSFLETAETAPLAAGFPAVCSLNDRLLITPWSSDRGD